MRTPRDCRRGRTPNRSTVEEARRLAGVLLEELAEDATTYLDALRRNPNDADEVEHEARLYAIIVTLKTHAAHLHEHLDELAALEDRDEHLRGAP